MSAAAATAILKRTINATRLIYFLYQILQIALSPLVALYLLYRGIQRRAYFAGLGERLGFLPSSLRTTNSGAIWFHAVSVGEVLSAVELIRRLRSELPNTPFFVSTTTLAGRATADQRLQGLAQSVFFAPLDYRSVVRRVLRRLRPAAVVILETEIWPNLYREAKRAGASLLIVNGRISDRALPRYRSASGFFRHALMWPDAIFTQSEEDSRRFVIAGAPAERVSSAGNLKYDFTPPGSGVAADVAGFLDRRRPEAIWIAASTMPPKEPSDPDEDDAVLSAFAAMNRPELLLILAPRRPERFDAAAEKLQRAGIPFARRTALAAAPEAARVLLLDSIGELAALFERADVVFMGGTLASRGGHNILEPAYFSKPVIAGPHMENFAAIADEFSAQHALLRIAGPEQLAAAVARLLENPELARAIGAKARELAMAKRGTVDRIAAEVRVYAGLGVPNPPRILAAGAVLTPLSWIWRAGHRINISRSLKAAKALDTKVVSIGALVMGGAGKTPIVAHLAERLLAAGRNPAILTRGYRRKSKGILIVPRGDSAPIDQTGDEAQTLVRSATAHVGIGADRFAAGLKMEQSLHPGIFLLDDGFQHVGLNRGDDIVLIDALDPLAGGVFPLGRLREPFENLARATAIIVSRVAPEQGTAGIERLIRRYNPHAPIFRSRVVPQRWVRLDGDVLGPSAFSRVGAFCGLGSPESFWRTLDDLGLEVAFRRGFSDHHPYSPSELRRLAAQATAAGVDALVTTEKDVMNLPEGASALLAPHPLYWLKIGVEIEREEELLQILLAGLHL
ncbi:MAG TPA: tetraacyldisaccharide 4'-kinase [Bryobacteraceae bacterium]